jgi:cell division protein FtsQ
LLTTVIVIGVAVIGWQYRVNLTFKGMRITGNDVTSTEKVVGLVGIEQGVRLYDINLDSVRLRIEEDPWVETAQAHRTAAGRINVRITERKAVAIVMQNGTVDHLVDSKGFRIPYVRDLALDLPVLTGNVGSFSVEPGNQRITDPSLREMLDALVQLDSRTLSLVSEIEVSPTGMISIHTTPIAGRDSIPVTLGENDFERKLIRLAAFWEQVLLRQPDEKVESIDLRYNNLISTT